MISELVASAESLGILLEPDGDHIHFSCRQPDVQEVLKPILDLIAENKKALLAFIKRRQMAVWPRESVEQVAKFGKFHNAFMPLLGKRVWTPKGEGVVAQVMGPAHIRVVLDNGDPNRMVDFNEHEVFPAGSRR